MTTATAPAPQQAMQRQAPTQALAKNQQFNEVRDLLKRTEDQLAQALPKHIPISYFMRVALTVVQRTPKLLECDRISLLGAMFQAAQLGLSLDTSLGQAYLVPYGKAVNFIPGYKGLVQLARNSGAISSLDADVVYERDLFAYEKGFNPTIKHVPFEGEDPGKVTKVYAWARLKDGGVQVKVMTVREVEKIRKRSQAANNGPWVSDWEWMAKKTVIKQLCKLLPMSTETQRAIDLDSRNELALPQNLHTLAPGHEGDAIEDDGDAVDTNTGEVIEMPTRVSEQPAAATTAPLAASAPTPLPPAAVPVDDEPEPPAAVLSELPDNADRIAEFEKKPSAKQPGAFYWRAVTQRGLSIYTRDTKLGGLIEQYGSNKGLCIIASSPATDGSQWRTVISIMSFIEEPGAEG